MSYPIKRELDGMYFRVNRGGKWQNVCFTDMTREEQEAAVKDRETQWLNSMIFNLADVVRNIGDALDIATYEREER